MEEACGHEQEEDYVGGVGEESLYEVPKWSLDKEDECGISVGSRAIKVKKKGT